MQVFFGPLMLLLTISVSNVYAENMVFEGQKLPSMQIGWEFVYEATENNRACTEIKVSFTGMTRVTRTRTRVLKKKTVNITTSAQSSHFAFNVEREVSDRRCTYRLLYTMFRVSDPGANIGESSIMSLLHTTLDSQGVRNIECARSRRDQKYNCRNISFVNPRAASSSLFRFNFALAQNNTREIPMPRNSVIVTGGLGQHIYSDNGGHGFNSEGHSIPYVAILDGDRIVGERMDKVIRCKEELTASGVEQECSIEDDRTGRVKKLYDVWSHQLIAMMKTIKPGNAPWEASADYHYHRFIGDYSKTWLGDIR